MQMRTINVNKNHILAVFFGIISGIKEHSFWWGVLIAVVGYAAFCGLDRLRAPLGQGPLDKYIGVKR